MKGAPCGRKAEEIIKRKGKQERDLRGGHAEELCLCHAGSQHHGQWAKAKEVDGSSSCWQSGWGVR